MWRDEFDAAQTPQGAAFALHLGQLYNVTQPTFAIGELIYSDTATTLASLAPNTAASKKFLSMTGTGSAGAAPVWETIEAADITDFSEAVDDRVDALIQDGTGITWSYNDVANTLTGNVTQAALTRVDDTNVTLTLGGAPSTALLTATSLTMGWSGQLAVGRGGSGAATLTGLLQGNGTSAFTTITNSTTVGQVLRVTGSNTYAWGALDLDDGDAVTGTLGLANGGTNAALTDPNADRFLFWDDSTGAVDWLTPGNGLTITTTTVAVDSASTTVDGIVELATDAETVTGTDTTRATTPSNITARLAAPGTIGGTTPGAATFTTLDATSTFSCVTSASIARSGNAPAIALTRTDTHGDAAQVGVMTFTGRDSGAAAQQYAEMRIMATLDNAGAEEGEFRFRVVTGGTDTEILTVTGTGVGGPAVATQANQETGTSTSTIVTPGRQHFHPGHPKCWAYITVSGGTPTLATNYNITSITDAATGVVSVTIATDFSSANWAGLVTPEIAAGAFAYTANKAAGTVDIGVRDAAGTLTDPTAYSLLGTGDHS